MTGRLAAYSAGQPPRTANRAAARQIGTAAARRASRSSTSASSAIRAAPIPPPAPPQLFPPAPLPEPLTPFALFAPPPGMAGSRGSAGADDIGAPPPPAPI